MFLEFIVLVIIYLVLHKVLKNKAGDTGDDVFIPFDFPHQGHDHNNNGNHKQDSIFPDDNPDGF